jgi:DNA-binding transcriptional LysR family regulator
MDLRHLRTFVTVAEQGTVSRASLQLGIAQPALSRQISDLEAELGIKLFDRIRQRLSLTDHGHRLLAECGAILHAVDGLTERARLLQHADSGMLKIAATPQMIEGVFSSFLHQYTARFPNIQLKLVEAVGTQAFPMLERGELHLVLATCKPFRPKNTSLRAFHCHH